MSTLTQNEYLAPLVKAPLVQAPSPAGAVEQPTPPVALPVTAPADPPMQTFIRPAARDRWMAAYVHYYKPQMVENIARSAMSGNMVSQWLMFDLMEQTWPRLVKNLNELKDGVIGLDWNLQPYAPKGQKPSPEAQRRCAILQQLLGDMQPDMTANENDFDDTLRDVLDAVGKGISVLEIDWQQKDIRLDLKGTGTATGAQFWVPRATRWIHPRYYGYPPYGVAQDRLMLNTSEVMASNPAAKFDTLWVPFPDNRFIVSIIKQKTGHPLNSSMLRILGFFWAAQNFTWEWFINLAQIFGSPIRWATYDSTQKNLLNLVSDMLRNMGSQAWGAFPEGTKLELEKGVESARDNPQKILIDMADTIADLMILGQTLTSTQGERGSQSLGKVHKDVRGERITATAGRSAKILNQQFLPAACRLNFGDDTECPKLVPTAKEAKAAIENAQRDQILLSMPGVEMGKEWFYGRHDIPVPEDGEDTIKGAVNAMMGDEPKPPGEPGVNDNDTATAQARGALDDLTNRVMQEVSGVQHRWLRPVKPAFRALLAAAKNGDLSDAQFLRAIQHAQKTFPELFADLDKQSLALAMEKAMGAAAFNGAVRGSLMRKAAA